MKRLPLYKSRHQPLETSERLQLTSSCERCDRRNGTRTVCQQSDAVRRGGQLTGGVLVVGSAPTKDEDDAARPFSSRPHGSLRRMIEEMTELPVIYTNALRCWKPAAKKATRNEVDACRPYLSETWALAQPSRILCLGKEAFMSVLGTDTPPDYCRRGYSYLSDGTPVFLLPVASTQVSNRFLLSRYRRDLEWALTAYPDPAPYGMEVQIVEDDSDDAIAAADLRSGRFFTFDTETAGIIGSDFFEVLCLAAVPSHGRSVYVWPSEALKSSPALRSALADPALTKVGHNLKYDLKAASHGLDLVHRTTGELLVRGVETDTLLWRKTLDSDVRGDLKYSAELVGMGGHKRENDAAVDAAVVQITEARANPRQRPLHYFRSSVLDNAVKYPLADPEAFAFGLVPRDILHVYCALDTVATARLRDLLEPEIEREPAFELVTEAFIKPSTAALAQVESWGMCVDEATVRANSTLLHRELAATDDKIRKLGCDVANLNSDAQMSEYLYGKLQLPVPGLTKGGAPSVKALHLKKIADKHPIIPLIIERNSISTLIKNFADGLLPHIHNGRVRTSINQDGTRSGRFSSSNPNLQNIPSRGKWAKVVKNSFNAPPGHAIIQLDYSQLELRIAAMRTGDPKMIEIYKSGVDFHRRTAELIAMPMWSIDPSEVDDKHRRSAKDFNFGVWYGQGDGTIAENLKISRTEAGKLRHEVMGQFEVAGRWIEECKERTRRTGVTWTWWGGKPARCRRLYNIASTDDYLASKASNGSFNSDIQGTAAQYMERTIQAVVQWILADGIPARVTNTVHDSILLEVPFAWVVEVIETVKGIMESWPSGEVPLVADADVGLSWGSLVSYPKLRTAGKAVATGMGVDEVAHLLELVDKDGSPLREEAREVIDLAERIGLAS